MSSFNLQTINEGDYSTWTGQQFLLFLPNLCCLIRPYFESLHLSNITGNTVYTFLQRYIDFC